MTSNSTPNAAPQIAPDIFDMERLAKPTVAPVEAANPAKDGQKVQPRQAQQAGQAALANIMQKAKPMHFGLAAAAAAMIWIGWPYVFSGDATTSQPASRLMLPATADTLAPKTSPPLPAISAARQQETSPAAAPAPETRLAQATDPPAVPPFAQPIPPAPPFKPAKPRRKAHHVETASRSLHLAKAKVSVGPANSKFSLNTVYTGQAWIADSERTYVVQVGDTIKGISILSIDARERRVVTSQGVIR